MTKRALFGFRLFGSFVALLAVLVAGGAILLSSGQFAYLANKALPNDWQLALNKGGFSANTRQASLPELTLFFQQCPLVHIEDFRLAWQSRQLSAEKATLDYRCLEKLVRQPTAENTEERAFSLNATLALIPHGSVEIKQLAWTNVPENPPRLKALLALSSEVKIAFLPENLTAYLKQQAVEFSGNFANGEFQGQIDYQPNEQEQHHLAVKSRVNDDFSLPDKLEADYRWLLPNTVLDNPALKQGQSRLSWQKQADQTLVGNWSFQSLQNPKNQFDLPIKFDGNTLDIQQGKFFWDWLADFPLQGFISAKLTPNSLTEIFPLNTYFRLSLQSKGNKGRGNIVLENQQGEVQKDRLTLPLRMTGEVKYGDFILYSAVPIEFQGKYDDLKVRFLPSALLRLAGRERYLNIKDLRFPLAGVRVDKNGINGRLQAIFKGDSPDFHNVELHLDGFARQFKMGFLDFFSTDKTQKINDLWQWKLWGNADLKAFRSPIKLQGRGQWQKNLVELNDFQASLGAFKLNHTAVQKIDLALSKPVKFAYEKWHLMGGAEMKSAEIRFDYGGKMQDLVAKLDFNGEIEKLNFKGEVKAGSLGPLRLFARRRLNDNASEFVGKLYWHEQPAQVFQSLISKRDWLITGGYVKGETSFSTGAKGLQAGGHFSIKNGEMVLPNGKISGIEFSLPYRYQQGVVQVGHRSAFEVNIDEINLGLPITQAKMKVRGYYPYSSKRPLHLSQLSMNLLGGSLEVERFSLPQTELAYLQLKGIDFERILSLIQYQQIDLKGKANATLPFWLSGKPCYICDGLLTQALQSRLKFTPELVKAIAESSGYTERLLIYLLNDTRITDLRSLINVGSTGEMVLDAKLKLELTEQERAKINFNYNHKENLFHLWHMINSSSYVEQNLENSIYQKLERKK